MPMGLANILWVSSCTHGLLLNCSSFAKKGGLACKGTKNTSTLKEKETRRGPDSNRRSRRNKISSLAH